MQGKKAILSYWYSMFGLVTQAHRSTPVCSQSGFWAGRLDGSRPQNPVETLSQTATFERGPLMDTP